MEKLHYYVVFTKAYPFIIGLIFILYVVNYTLVKVLLTYVTEEWINVGLQRAVQIVTLREGLTKMAVFIVHLLNAHLDRFRAVVGLTGIFVFGLVMLMVVDPDEKKNIKILYLAILFISLGKAGKKSLKLFVKDQLRVKEQCGKVNEDRVKWRTRIWWYIPVILVPCLVPFLVATWDFYQIFVTVLLFVELLGFSSGKPLHAFNVQPDNNQVKKVYHVVKAALLKRHLSYSKSSPNFYENKQKYLSPLPPDVCYLRWLDQAAIVDRSTSSKEQVDGNLLFRVEEVEEVKHVLWPFIYSLTFLLYSIGHASGTTFYLDQARRINYDFPVIIFLIIKKFSADMAFNLPFKRLFPVCPDTEEELFRRNVRVINIGIAFSWLSSFTAFGFEAYEKHNKNRVGDLSVWWLTPQFIFLGLTEGFLKKGIEGLTKNRVSESMRLFGSNLRQFVIGVGRILNFLLVSRREIYSSHFGRLFYYGLLGVIGLGNSAVAIGVSEYFSKPKRPRIQEEVSQTSTPSRRSTPPPTPPRPPPCCCRPPVIVCPICSMEISDGNFLYIVSDV